MREIFKNYSGEITKSPSKNTLCFKCGNKLGDKCGKCASLFIKDDNLTITWNWFCENCTNRLYKIINTRGGKSMKVKIIIKECPFCKKQFTEKELDDLFVDEKGFTHCPNCGSFELTDVSEE